MIALVTDNTGVHSASNYSSLLTVFLQSVSIDCFLCRKLHSAVCRTIASSYLETESIFIITHIIHIYLLSVWIFNSNHICTFIRLVLKALHGCTMWDRNMKLGYIINDNKFSLKSGIDSFTITFTILFIINSWRYVQS